MGTPLTGTSVASSYSGLLKIGDNSAISTTIKQLSDGAGNDINVWLAENYTEFRQALNIAPFMAGGSASLAFRQYSTGSPGVVLCSVEYQPVYGYNPQMVISTASAIDGVYVSVGANSSAVIKNGEVTQTFTVAANGGLKLIQNGTFPTLGVADEGIIAFNKTTKKFRGWTGSAWVDFH